MTDRGMERELALFVLQANGLVPIVEPEVTLGEGDYRYTTTLLNTLLCYSTAVLGALVAFIVQKCPPLAGCGSASCTHCSLFLPAPAAVDASAASSARPTSQRMCTPMSSGSSTSTSESQGLRRGPCVPVVCQWWYGTTSVPCSKPRLNRRPCCALVLGNCCPSSSITWCMWLVVAVLRYASGGCCVLLLWCAWVVGGGRVSVLEGILLKPNMILPGLDVPTPPPRRSRVTPCAQCGERFLPPSPASTSVRRHERGGGYPEPQRPPGPCLPYREKTCTADRTQVFKPSSGECYL